MKNKNVDQSHQNTRPSVDHTKIEYQELNLILLVLQKVSVHTIMDHQSENQYKKEHSKHTRPQTFDPHNKASKKKKTNEVSDTSTEVETSVIETLSLTHDDQEFHHFI